ncbi:hypothetical protein JXB11_03410 [Candidatus Woesearchaeota archaeon]|nr:hypothetical protein [Candidatus Woesearchaeota archaeon]
MEKKCEVCSESVTNPICGECLSSAVRSWLRGRYSWLIPEVSAMNNNASAKGPYAECVICGSRIDLCSGCYYEEVQKLLYRADPNIAHEFSSFFNFEMQNLKLEKEVSKVVVV